VRTNPKTGSPKNGSALPRTSSRRTTQPKNQQPVAPSTAAESDIQGEIARLAYFLWEARGGVGGSPEEDWLRAEQEILTRSKA
jgi:hypothetical protein